MGVYYDLISLLCGGIAWCVPPVALLLRKRCSVKTGFGLSVLSGSLGCVSLCAQIFWADWTVAKEDWAALRDVCPTLRWVTFCFMAVLAIENGIVWHVYSRKGGQ